MQTNQPTVEIELIASRLRPLERDLREILDAIEKRDLTATQVRENLGRMADGIRRIRTLIQTVD